MNYILIIWIWTGTFGYPSYFGDFATKQKCEAAFAEIEKRFPGNGTTINNFICVEK